MFIFANLSSKKRSSWCEKKYATQPLIRKTTKSVSMNRCGLGPVQMNISDSICWMKNPPQWWQMRVYFGIAYSKQCKTLVVTIAGILGEVVDPKYLQLKDIKPRDFCFLPGALRSPSSQDRGAQFTHMNFL